MVVRNLHTSKVAGKDDIQPEVVIECLIYFFNITWKSETELFNWQTGMISLFLCFKGGHYKMCSNYRETSHNSLPGNKYARDLERTLHPIVKPKVEEKQCSLHPGHGNVDQLFTLAQLSAKS